MGPVSIDDASNRQVGSEGQLHHHGVIREPVPVLGIHHGRVHNAILCLSCLPWPTAHDGAYVARVNATDGVASCQQCGHCGLGWDARVVLPPAHRWDAPLQLLCDVLWQHGQAARCFAGPATSGLALAAVRPHDTGDDLALVLAALRCHAGHAAQAEEGRCMVVLLELTDDSGPAPILACLHAGWQTPAGQVDVARCSHPKGRGNHEFADATSHAASNGSMRNR
mmetsp:Transcript_46675/g.117428  ORF Transcript_46675/g.117428 Transcript_46675/m.117428 type:complete len:224 (+) Transcript_46675:208-879(+)